MPLYVPGSKNIDNGVLLALNNLNDIAFNANGNDSTFTVGPGNRWLETIGVSGLNLIGGFHYFINKYGLAMANVVQYDVVLGNGTQVGGANNFGFTSKAYAIPKLNTTILQFNTSAVEAYVQATVAFTENDTPDLVAGAVLDIRYDPEGTESPPSRFSNYTVIGPVSQIDNVTTPTVWHTQPPPTTAATVTKTNGVGNVWDFEDSQSLIRLVNNWQNAADGLRVTNWAAKFLDFHHSVNQQMGLASEFLYMGDAGKFQNPFLAPRKRPADARHTRPLLHLVELVSSLLLVVVVLAVVLLPVAAAHVP
ncbi:hypothetical protein B0H17DRAFT_1205785 [Mycena rosella]|uniref:Uncharacterized protein n=1 Tax=Mycena rosella TaxID=1033263 RepID=A0AAD7G9X4_MYCRO|nr:hypothetical protein B0H17DRAFT_1205785 [Mycena rosella]